jgi:hypothetical protein
VLRGTGDAVGLSAELGWDRVALGDDAPGLLEGDLAAVKVAHDIAFAGRQQATIRVNSAAAIWHTAELWCLPAWTMSRW